MSRSAGDPASQLQAALRDTGRRRGGVHGLWPAGGRGAAPVVRKRGGPGRGLPRRSRPAPARHRPGVQLGRLAMAERGASRRQPSRARRWCCAWRRRARRRWCRRRPRGGPARRTCRWLGRLLVRLPPQCVPDQAEPAALDGIARLVVLHAQGGPCRRAVATHRRTRFPDLHAEPASAGPRGPPMPFAARQGTASPLSVLFIDLDWSADQRYHGHACGDHCLRPWRRPCAGSCARAMSSAAMAARNSGVVACSDAAGGRVLAERLRRTIEGWASNGRAPIRVTASFGLAGMREQDTGLHRCSRADKAPTRPSARVGTASAPLRPTPSSGGARRPWSGQVLAPVLQLAALLGLYTDWNPVKP